MKALVRNASLGVLLLALAAPLAAAGDVFPFPVHTHTLDNGLRVVVIPYDSPGVVAYYTVVRTGSRQEVEAGYSGFAHFFEHMMFRGTERFSGDAYNDVLKRMGADSNAFTTDDFTNYYIVGPAAELDTIMDIESDRFQNLSYSEEAFRTEALAVLGEYNKNVSQPWLPMSEKLRDLAFTRHTYKHTTMGLLADIKAMPTYYDFSLRFFDRFYRPENCIVLVVGDVEPEAVQRQAQAFYGDWKKGFRDVAIETEPAQDGERSADLDWPGPTPPYLMLGYRMPAFEASSKVTASLDLIAQLLTAESAPLYREVVVEKRWADILSSSASAHRDPYLFTLVARVKAPELMADVEARVQQALADLAAKPVDEKRLERIKSYLRYSFAGSLDSPSAVGSQAAWMLNLTGDLGAINQLYATYQSLTPADIQRTARQIFKASQRTKVTLSHKGTPQADGGEAAGESSQGAGQ
ncbi:MAG: pitrilysin family protein [Acidobacteriota bacterium]